MTEIHVLRCFVSVAPTLDVSPELLERAHTALAALEERAAAAARRRVTVRAGSHAARMAELERRIGTVLAECSSRVPMYRMAD